MRPCSFLRPSAGSGRGSEKRPETSPKGRVRRRDERTAGPGTPMGGKACHGYGTRDAARRRQAGRAEQAYDSGEGGKKASRIRDRRACPSREPSGGVNFAKKDNAGCR